MEKHDDKKTYTDVTANYVQLAKALRIAFKPLKATPEQLSSVGLIIDQLPLPWFFNRYFEID